MKIISWNVNGIRAVYKKGLMSFLKQHQPDIFCVQETKAHPNQVPAELLDSNWMFSYWSSAMTRKGYSGVATFTLEEPKQVGHEIGKKEFDEEGRFLISHHGLSDTFKLYNVYFPNGRSKQERLDYKTKFNESFLEILKKEVDSGQEVIVLGDYNVAPQEIDLYDPVKYCDVSGFLPQERKWFQQLLDIGFVDTFRHFHPDRKDCYTWWSLKEAKRLSNKGWRIDLICVTEGLMDRVMGVDILHQVEGSDHCPIAIEIET